MTAVREMTVEHDAWRCYGTDQEEPADELNFLFASVMNTAPLKGQE